MVNSVKKLLLNDGCEISSHGAHDPIRYLGVTFSDKLSFDTHKTLTTLSHKIETLATSPLLQVQ